MRSTVTGGRILYVYGDYYEKDKNDGVYYLLIYLSVTDGKYCCGHVWGWGYLSTCHSLPLNHCSLSKKVATLLADS